jgi:hypothetical protein
MSDRKYRQRGYQDEPDRPKGGGGDKDQRPKAERPPREMRAPNMPGFRQVVRCARCGGEVALAIGPTSQCSRCGADLHTCAQCVSFDPGSRFECQEPIPARISPKDTRNACAIFEPRVTSERETRSQAPASARKAFDDLFG